MAKQSMSDEFYQGIGNAIDDIRSKFEESVYGRAVTEHGGESVGWPQAQEPEQSFGSVTHNIDVGPTRDQWPQADNSHTQRIEEIRVAAKSLRAYESNRSSVAAADVRGWEALPPAPSGFIAFVPGLE